MKTLSLALAALAAASSFAQNGWKSPKTTSATVTERYADQPERKVDLVTGEGSASYKTSAGINGELSGIPRSEVVSPKGIFTWMEGKPETALQLFVPTSPDVLDFFERPAFSRADLEFNLQGIEKALGKKVLAGKTESVAGRECLTLRVLDKPDSPNTDYQKLWVDKETGITMRQQDYFGDRKTYEREVTRIEFSNSTSSALFEPAANAKVIRGLVSPNILVKWGQFSDLAQFKSDIRKVNEVKAPLTPWAGAFDTAVPFAYALTSAREIKNNFAVMPSANSNGQNGQNGRNGFQNGRRQNQFGRRGQFQGQASQAVMVTTATNDLVIATDDGSPGINRSFRITVDQNGNRQVTELPPPGQLPGGNGSGSGTAGAGSQGTPAKSFPFAQSDFVDSDTGDTLTLLQVSGRPIEPSLGALVLGTPKVYGDKNPENRGLDNAKSYTVAKPFKANVVTWKHGNVAYALVSTSLPAEKLLDIAVKVKTPN